MHVHAVHSFLEFSKTRIGANIAVQPQLHPFRSSIASGLGRACNPCSTGAAGNVSGHVNAALHGSKPCSDHESAIEWFSVKSIV